MKGTLGSLLICTPVLILALCRGTLAGEEASFLSNEIGMPLEPLQKDQETPEYRLVVRRSTNGEIRILLNREGVELKRWETRMGDSGIPLEEKEWKEGALQKQLLYDSRGRIIQEVEFEGEKERSSFEYLYVGSNYKGLVFKSFNSDSGPQDFGYREEVLYSPSGSYRGLYRQYDSGATRIARASQSRGVLQREVFQGAGISFLARYNSKGDAIYQEVRKEGVPIEQSRFWYTDQPTYHLERIESENLVTGTRKVLWYSVNGLLEKETELIKDVFLQETRYTYQEKQLIQKELRTRRSRYRWEYRYNGDGKKIEEKQYENESLVLHVEYSPPEPFSRIESRYKGGSLVMRTYFKEDSEALVEYYRDGALLRSVKKGSIP